MAADSSAAFAPWSCRRVLVHAATPASPDAGNPLVEPRFESVGVGIIPRHVVPTVAQDRAGFMWIATGDGLVRFDGYRFRPQARKTADPAARNLGWIRCLAGRTRWPPVDRHRVRWTS
jgi:hypothetical protein